MGELISFDHARKSLQVCASVDEAKDILDQAEAMRVYAHQVENNEMEQWLSEIKLRARRRIGEISKGLETITAEESGAAGGKGLPTTGKSLKKDILKAAGLSTSVANRCEKIALIPQDEFEAALQDAKDNDKPVTYADVEKVVNRDKKENNREQKRQDNKAKIETSSEPEKLTGVYSTIVIDPPWDWGDEGDKDQLGRAKPDYHTMSIDELKELPVGNLADEDAHIYLWITNRSLPKGFDLLEAWGFRYITAITWVKPHFGMGNYFRGQTEHVLFGVKGSMPLKRKDQGTVFEAGRGPNGHSSKPIEFYDLVESCSYGPYLEMFSRTDRKDWTHLGEGS